MEKPACGLEEKDGAPYIYDFRLEKANFGQVKIGKVEVVAGTTVNSIASGVVRLGNVSCFLSGTVSKQQLINY